MTDWDRKHRGATMSRGKRAWALQALRPGSDASIAVIISVTLDKSFDLHEPQFPPVTQLISGEKMGQGCDDSQKPSFLLGGWREKGAGKMNGERGNSEEGS